MKTISRRLRKLEEGFGLVPETEEGQRLRERLEAWHRRLLEARARGDYDGPIPQDSQDRSEEERNALSRMTIVEILERGRERARAGRPAPPE